MSTNGDQACESHKLLSYNGTSPTLGYMALAPRKRPSGVEGGFTDKTASTVFTNDAESQHLLTVDAASLAVSYASLCQRELSDEGDKTDHPETADNTADDACESHELQCLNGTAAAVE